MDGLRITRVLMVVVVVATFGCTGSHRRIGPEPDAIFHPEPASIGSATTPATASLGPESTSVAPTESQELLDVMAEVRQLGELDPAIEAKLMENLRQTRPELWPLVVRQFHAAMAYRQNQAGEAKPAASGPDESADARSAIPDTSPTNTAALPASPIPTRTSWTRSNVPAGPLKEPADGNVQVSKLGRPAPVAQSSPATIGRSQSIDEPEPQPANDRVLPAAYAERASDDWRSHLRQAARILRSKTNPAPESGDEIAQHAQLRMLYLLAGQRDQALEPIPMVAPGTQDFWSNEFHGLATLWGGASSVSPRCLATEAHRPLRDAVTRLGESCQLVVSNLAFVSEVQSFGSYKQFEKYVFSPRQQLLLYAELDNFASRETEEGFHTVLKGSYQIFDESGRRVTKQEFDTNEEYCNSRRHDFFIGYEFWLPERIYPGRHVLKLTIEDVISNKVGESAIEFTVLDSNEEN